MIAVIFSYLTAFKFWVGVVAGAAIGAPALKAAWRGFTSWVEARLPK